MLISWREMLVGMIGMHISKEDTFRVAWYNFHFKSDLKPISLSGWSGTTFIFFVILNLVREPGLTSTPYSSTRGRPARSCIISFFFKAEKVHKRQWQRHTQIQIQRHRQKKSGKGQRTPAPFLSLQLFYKTEHFHLNMLWTLYRDGVHSIVWTTDFKRCEGNLDMIWEMFKEVTSQTSNFDIIYEMLKSLWWRSWFRWWGAAETQSEQTLHLQIICQRAKSLNYLSIGKEAINEKADII